jgi:hypothetical protein
MPVWIEAVFLGLGSVTAGIILVVETVFLRRPRSGVWSRRKAPTEKASAPGWSVRPCWLFLFAEGHSGACARSICFNRKFQDFKVPRLNEVHKRGIGLSWQADDNDTANSMPRSCGTDFQDKRTV